MQLLAVRSRLTRWLKDSENSPRRFRYEDPGISWLKDADHPNANGWHVDLSWDFDAAQPPRVVESWNDFKFVFGLWTSGQGSTWLLEQPTRLATCARCVPRRSRDAQPQINGIVLRHCSKQPRTRDLF